MKMMKSCMLGLALSVLAFSGLANAGTVEPSLEVKAAYMVEAQGDAQAAPLDTITVSQGEQPNAG